MPPKQKFIPGLNSRPDDVEMPPKQPEKTDLDYLIEDFLKKKKNAAMCLHEYCQKSKIELKFKEGPVDMKMKTPTAFGCFGCFAIVDGIQYPQGVGSTKKEAKTEASRLCLRVLIGMDDYDPVEESVDIDDNRFVEVRDLLDICTEQEIFYEKMMNRDMKGVHTCTVYLSNRDPIKFSSEDRELAVVGAHREAIRILRGYDASNVVPDLGYDEEEAPLAATGGERKSAPRVPDPFLAQQREEEAYDALDRTLQSLPSELTSFDHHIAVIFVSNQEVPGYEGVGKVVAFGTGNSTLGVEQMTKDGRCVVDSCATTTARRALKRYLGQEMLACYTKSKESIFARNPINPTRLRLRAGYEFHLYASHPPEGDYKDFLSVQSPVTPEEQVDIAKGAHVPNFTDDCHGLFKGWNEHGMVEPSDQLPDQLSQEQVKLANELWTMTASDKLLRWNILGIQGAAYSIFINPIYLKSITIGFQHNNDHGHLCRAVCCRVYPELAEQFPPGSGYTINHPILNFCQSPDVKAAAQPGIRASPHSINWSIHDTRPELTDCLTGRSNPASPFQVSQVPLSRQCKAGLHLKWFKDLCPHGAQIMVGKSPAEVKNYAKDYQKVKAAFLQHCRDNGIGKWLHVPQESWTLGK